MLLYFLIPIYSKFIAIDFSDNIYANLTKIIQTFKSNKGLLIKFFLYSFQAYLCFNFIIDYLPKNQICSSIITDRNYFDNIAYNNSHDQSNILFYF